MEVSFVIPLFNCLPLTQAMVASLTASLPAGLAHGSPERPMSTGAPLPMAFAPKSGGTIPSTLPDATIHANISPSVWRNAEIVARVYLASLRRETGFSHSFNSCIDALENHIESAARKIARLTN